MAKKGGLLNLNIDFKTLAALLPTALSLLGTVTKKDKKNGAFAFEQTSNSGNILGYVLNLVGNKDGGTTLDISSQNDSEEENSNMGGILSSLGKLGNLTGGSGNSGGLLDSLGGLLGNRDDDDRDNGGLLSVLGSVMGGGSNNDNDSGGGLLDTLGDLVGGNDKKSDDGGDLLSTLGKLF